MKVAFVIVSTAQHQMLTATNLCCGMARFGDEGVIFNSGAELRRALSAGAQFDAVSVWGWRRALEWRAQGFNILLMERAYVKDRFAFVSLGWNGLNGRAQWPIVNDSGARWRRLFSRMLKPWKWETAQDAKGYALLLGQVPTDAAVSGISFVRWATEMAHSLKQRGHKVKYRAHPQAMSCRIAADYQSTSEETLEESLSGAALAVTYNSNSGVDAVCAGVPTYAHDIGAMSWDVSSHDLDNVIFMPDRAEWCMRMAWRQWLQDELSNGVAWAAVKSVLPLRVYATSRRIERSVACGGP